jgi:hypothetical protein
MSLVKPLGLIDPIRIPGTLLPEPSAGPARPVGPTGSLRQLNGTQQSVLPRYSPRVVGSNPSGPSKFSYLRPSYYSSARQEGLPYQQKWQSAPNGTDSLCGGTSPKHLFPSPTADGIIAHRCATTLR